MINAYATNDPSSRFCSEMAETKIPDFRALRRMAMKEMRISSSLLEELNIEYQDKFAVPKYQTIYPVKWVLF